MAADDGDGSRFDVVGTAALLGACRSRLAQRMTRNRLSITSLDAMCITEEQRSEIRSLPAPSP